MNKKRSAILIIIGAIVLGAMIATWAIRMFTEQDLPGVFALLVAAFMAAMGLNTALEIKENKAQEKKATISIILLIFFALAALSNIGLAIIEITRY